MNHSTDEADVMWAHVASMRRGKRAIRVILADANTQMYRPTRDDARIDTTDAAAARSKRPQDNATKEYAEATRGHFEGMRMTMGNDTRTWWKTCHRHYLGDDTNIDETHHDNDARARAENSPAEQLDTYDALPQTPTQEDTAQQRAP